MQNIKAKKADSKIYADLCNTVDVFFLKLKTKQVKDKNNILQKIRKCSCTYNMAELANVVIHISGATYLVFSL